MECTQERVCFFIHIFYSSHDICSIIKIASEDMAQMYHLVRVRKFSSVDIAWPIRKKLRLLKYQSVGRHSMHVRVAQVKTHVICMQNASKLGGNT